MMPVNVFDKLRFNKPIIAKLIKGKSGTKNIYLDINLIDYFLLITGCKPSNYIQFVKIRPLSILGILREF